MPIGIPVTDRNFWLYKKSQRLVTIGLTFKDLQFYDWNMIWLLGNCFSLELCFCRKNVREDGAELICFRAVSLSGKHLCIAQDIARKKEEYKDPFVECCCVNQEALNWELIECIWFYFVSVRFWRHVCPPSHSYHWILPWLHLQHSILLEALGTELSPCTWVIDYLLLHQQLHDDHCFCWCLLLWMSPSQSCLCGCLCLGMFCFRSHQSKHFMVAISVFSGVMPGTYQAAPHCIY